MSMPAWAVTGEPRTQAKDKVPSASTTAELEQTSGVEGCARTLKVANGDLLGRSAHS